MQAVFIRHGKTHGNTEGRYVGRTDEPLCKEGIEQLKKKQFAEVEVVVVSPMRRCTETAEILFSGQKTIVVPDFRECDFGKFEMKNYAELNGDATYQAWIDSGGELAFPEGECRAAFVQRCCGAFEDVMNRLEAEGVKTAAFVIHGGTIMSILSSFAVPLKTYYHWQVKNGEAYRGEIGRNDAGAWAIKEIEKLV